MHDREKTIRGLECCVRDVRGKAIRTCDDCPYDIDGLEKPCQMGLMTDALALLREQEPRVMSLEEAIEGKNGLEIDPYVFVEIKGREDIFIGSVNDASHYNYPDLSFGVGECFQINRSFPASKIYPNTDYMKIVRCWTHKPSNEQRKAAKWDE